MAKIEEALTSSDPFAADAAEIVKGMLALESKSARLSFGKATYNAELQSVRNAARAAGHSIVKLPNVPRTETDDTITEGFKIRDKIEVTPHTRPNRKKSEATTVDPPATAKPAEPKPTEDVTTKG